MDWDGIFNRRLRAIRVSRGLEGRIMGAFRDVMLMKALYDEQSANERTKASGETHSGSDQEGGIEAVGGDDSDE